MSLSKTGISLNEPAIFSESVIMKGLSTDPETQPETIILTLSSLAVNQVYKRIYEVVYATAINTVIVVTPLVLGVWTVPNLVYGLSFGKNCLPVGNTITIDGGVTSHLSTISYNFSYASAVVLPITYQSAIRVNGFIITSSICDFTMRSNTEMDSISNTSIFTLNAGDDISLVVRNTLGNDAITINRMAITINKIFQ